MALIPQGEVQVYIETPDGYVFSGNAHVASITVSQNMLDVTELGAGMMRSYIAGLTTFDIELSGTGEPLWVRTRDGIAKDIRSAIEWECLWCGAIMTRKHRQCSQCGGWRSFVYDTL